MDDSTYVNDGSHYQPNIPDETQKQISEEIKKAYDSMPFIDELLKWFDESIQAVNEVSTVKQESVRRKIDISVVVEAYDIVREILEAKKGELEQLKLTFED